MPPNRPFDILLEDELDEVLEHEAEKSDADDDDDTDDDDTDQFERVPAMGDIVMNLWKACAKILESDFAICGWYLCVFQRVTDGVRNNDTSERREAVERVIEGLYDGLGFKSDSADNLSDTFWSEWTDFKNQMGKFSSKRMWNSWPAIEGESYIWHDRYSLKVTDVMGYVACHVASKVIGIGAAERSWGDVKQLKSDKRAHLCIEYVERQGVIFGAASLHEARVIRKNAETVEGVDTTYLWTDEDAAYDLGIGKFGIDVEEL
jgi:hypothetical protein